MYKDKVVLCGASAYEKKYYFNEDFSALPQQIKDELQIMCVMYTEEIGGILTLEFDEEGNLQFQVEALEADAMFDDIGSALRIKELRKTKRELLESLELYYRVSTEEASYKYSPPGEMSISVPDDPFPRSVYLPRKVFRPDQTLLPFLCGSVHTLWPSYL